MKKILFLGDVNSPHIQKWVSGVASLGYQTGLFSMAPPLTKWFEEAGVMLLNGQRNISPASDLQKIRYVKFKSGVSEAVQSFHPDILHAHYATSYGQLGRLSGFHPFIISAWGSDIFDFPKRSF